MNFQKSSFDTFLSKHAVGKNEANVANFSKTYPGGSYHVSHAEFYKQYCEEYLNEQRKTPLCIGERSNGVHGLYIDLDVKMTEIEASKRGFYDRDNQHYKRFYTETQVKEFVTEVQNVIGETYEDTEKVCFVLEKGKHAREVETKSGQFIKDGLHLHFPFVFVSNKDAKFIRQQVLKRVSPTSILNLGKPDDVYDSLVYREDCTWLVLGSVKKEGEPYLCTYFLEARPGKLARRRNMSNPLVTKYIDSHPLVMDFTDKVALALRPTASTNAKENPLRSLYTNIDSLLLRQIKFTMMFSVDGTIDTRQVKPKKEYQKELGDRKPKAKVPFQDIRTTDEVEKDAKYIKENSIISLLSLTRSDWGKQWRQVLRCLRDIYDGSEEGLKVAHAFSSLSPKYEDEHEVNDIWYKMSASDKPYTLSFLLRLVKEDSPKEYAKLPKYSSLVLTKTLVANLFKGNMGHALIVKELRSNDLVYTSTNNTKCYYKWDEESKLWKRWADDMLFTFVGNALEEVVDAYKQYLSTVPAPAPDDVQEIQNQKNNRARYNEENQKIHSTSHLNAVIRLLKELFWNEHFKFNPYPNLLPVATGKVVNLKTGEIRERTRDDRFSSETPVFPNDDNAEAVEKWFHSITDDNEEWYNYLQKVCGHLISAEVADRFILLLIGEKSNGKSTFLKALSGVLGVDFYHTVGKETFIKSRDANRHAGAATPHLIPFSGCRRVISCSETGETDELNSDFLKMVSGGDKIPMRANYGDPFETYTTAKCIIATNNAPKFNIQDAALIDRLQYIPFPRKFLDIDVDNKEAKEYRKDKVLGHNIEHDYLPSVLSWMIKGGKMYYDAKKELTLPKSLAIEKKAKVANQDYVQNFFDSRLQKLSDDELTAIGLLPADEQNKQGIKVTDLYFGYDAYMKEEYSTKAETRASFFKQLESKKDTYKVIWPGRGSPKYLVGWKYTSDGEE